MSGFFKSINNKKYFLFPIFLFFALILLSPVLADWECAREIKKPEMSRDDDFDGYPDFIEKALGYDPKKDDCLSLMKCGELAADITRLGEKKNILIILDASGSMSSLTRSGRSRMEEAKEAVNQYVQQLPPDVNVGLMVYSARQIKGKGCERIEMMQDIKPLNKESLVNIVNSIEQAGATPMALSIQQAIRVLEAKEKDDNHVILISDGQESCGGNPIEAMYALKNSKAKPVIHVVGFGVSGRTKKQLACMASVSGGKYHDVADGKALVEALQYSFKQLDEFYKTMVCLQRDLNKYLACETQKYNRSNAHILQKKLFLKTQEEKEAYSQAEKSITHRYKKEVKGLSLSKFEQKKNKLRKDIDSISRSK